METPVGKVFGQWTVLGAGEPKENRDATWLVSCNRCGVKRCVRAYMVKTGGSTQCRSCAYRYRKTLTVQDAAERAVFRQYRKGAKNRGIVFKLTAEELSKIIWNPCSYCGCTPDTKWPPTPRNEFEAKRGHVLRNGIDRVDNAKGYVVGNVVPCCKRCQYMKMDSTVIDFLQHCRRIIDFNGARL